MSTPTGSLEELRPSELDREKRRLIITVVLLTLAIVLIIVLIVRNEIKVVSLDKDQSRMLKRICQATVTNC